MIKGSLAEFSSTLKEANIAGLLEIAKWANDTTDWKIVAHDIVTSAPFMVGLPCWKDVAGDSCYNHQTADDGYKNLKWELQHLSFMISSMTEMLRLKMKCRVVEIFPTLQKFAVIVRYHNQRWTLYRNSYPLSTFCVHDHSCYASWETSKNGRKWAWERGVLEKFPPLKGPRDVPGYDLCKTQRSLTDSEPGRTFNYVNGPKHGKQLCCDGSGLPDGKSRRAVLQDCGKVYWHMMMKVLERSTKQFLLSWKAISNLGLQAQGYFVHNHDGPCIGKNLGVGKVHTVQQCADACLKNEWCAHFNWRVTKKVTACKWTCYLARYSDLKKAFGNSNLSHRYRLAKEHYYSHGVFEGRDCTCGKTYGDKCHFHASCPTTVKSPDWVAYSAQHGSWRQSAECGNPTVNPTIPRRRRSVHRRRRRRSYPEDHEEDF